MVPKLEEAMASTHAGQLLGRVLAIDAALQMRIHVTLADITCEEFAALHALYVERGNKMTEDNKRDEQEAKRRGQR